MFRVACAGCGISLTDDLVEVPLPKNELGELDGDVPLALMGRGAFARSLAFVSRPGHRVEAVPDGTPATFVVNPDDARNVSRHPDQRRLNGCCNLDGLDGPNLVCGRCGREVATLQNDCWVSRPALRFEVAAVRLVKHLGA